MEVWMATHIYLAKANNDLISHCACSTALITSPPQMDCPWCGCGWLFTCLECRKAFTFAVAIETEQSWDELARVDLLARSKTDPSVAGVAAWVESMMSYVAEAKVGEKYVALDGRIIPVSQQRVDFDGWHASHRFDFVPQVAAMSDPTVMKRILGSEEYWQTHAITSMSPPSDLGKPAVRDREKRWWEFWR
jgi:hypothetical protein